MGNVGDTIEEIDILIAEARAVNGYVHPNEKAEKFLQCLELAKAKGDQKQILYCSANYYNALGICQRNQEEYEEAIETFLRAEEEFLKLRIIQSAYFCGHQAINCAQQLHDIDSYLKIATEFIKKYSSFKDKIRKQDLSIYDEIENNLSRIKEFRQVPINKKLELMTNESLTRLIETSYICIQHSPQTVSYILSESDSLPASFKPQVRNKINISRQMFKSLKEAKIEPVIKAFENLKNFSRMTLDSIEGIIIDVGNTAYSRYWGEEIRTLTIAIDKFQRAFTFRTKNINLEECNVGNKVKMTNIGVIPEFSRLFSLKNYSIHPSNSQIDILSQFPEFLLINIEDECVLLKSYNFEEFVIDPLSEELCNFFISPITITKVSSYKAMGYFVLDITTPKKVVKTIIQIVTFRNMFGEGLTREVEENLKKKYFLGFCQGIYTGPSEIEEKSIQILSLKEISRADFERYTAYAYFRFRKVGTDSEIPDGVNSVSIPKEVIRERNKWYFVPPVFGTREEFFKVITNYDKENVKDFPDTEIRTFLLTNPSFFDTYKRYYHHYTDVDLQKKFEWPIKESKSLLKNYSRKVVEVLISDFTIFVYWDKTKNFNTIEEALQEIKKIKPTEIKFILSGSNSNSTVLRLILKNLKVNGIKLYYYGSKSEGNSVNYIFKKRY